jgi:hypothetical protein
MRLDEKLAVKSERLDAGDGRKRLTVIFATGNFKRLLVFVGPMYADLSEGAALVIAAGVSVHAKPYEGEVSYY